MPNRPIRHWATLLAVGLPLIVTGCAGSGYPGPTDDAAAVAAASHVDALSLAEKLKSEGNFASAVTMYQQAHQANPGDVRPLLGMGESLLGVGANAEAANAYASALAIDPNNLEALRGLGHARILMGQPQLAVGQYQTALKLAPKDVRALNGIGVAEDMTGDHAAAQASYRAALAIDPNNQSAMNNMALSLALAGDNAGAIKILEDVSNSATATAVNRQNLALLYGINGQLDQAQQMGRADLPADIVKRNIAALSAGTDPAKREELLKESLGVELKGRQYTPPATPIMPLTNLAQASADDEPVYLSTEDSGTLPVITTGRGDKSQTVASLPATVAKRSSGDAWSDNWDEELVDSADVNGQPAPAIAAAPSKAADEPLPPAPSSTTTVVAVSNPDTNISPQPTGSPAAAPATAAGDTAVATSSPSNDTAAPTPLVPQTATVSIPTKFMSSSSAIADDKPTPSGATAAGPAVTEATAPAVATPSPQPVTSDTPPATAETGVAQASMSTDAPTPPMGGTTKAAMPAAPTPAAASATAAADASTSKPETTAVADATPPVLTGSAELPTPPVTAPANASASNPVTATPADATPPAMTGTTESSPPSITATVIGSAKVYTVQLASYRSEAEATVGWQTLTAQQSDLLSGLPHAVAKADLGTGKGIYFRLQAGSFADAKAAKSLCKDLKNRAIDCMVVEATPGTVTPPASTRQSMLAPSGIQMDWADWRALATRTTASA